MFKRIFGIKLLLVALTFLTVWGLTVLSWHNAFRVPTAGDIAFGFVVLPTALCAGVWSVSELYKRITQPFPEVASNEVVDLAGGVDHTLPSQLEIRDWAVSLPVGNNTSDALPVVVKAAGAGFLSTLKNDQLRPANAAWVNISSAADLFDNESMQYDLDSASIHKSLALAESVLEELLTKYLSVDARAKEDGGSVIHIHYLLPERWGDKVEDSIKPWLRATLDNWLGGERHYESSVTAVAGAPQALIYLDHLNTRINAQQADDLHLLLISDSYVEQDSLSDQKPLVHSGNFVPGEGACALLLAKPAASPELSSHATLHRMVTCQRSESIDDPDDVQIENTVALVAQSNPDAAAVAFVMTDAGNGKRQREELFGVMAASLPKIKADKACYNLPVSCGEMGVVTPFAALALAAARSVETEKAGLLISVADPSWRAALLVKPPIKKVATAAPGTPV